jgi:hypothetical protein
VADRERARQARLYARAGSASSSMRTLCPNFATLRAAFAVPLHVSERRRRECACRRPHAFGLKRAHTLQIARARRSFMTAMLANFRATAAVLCLVGALTGACSSSTIETSMNPSPTKCQVAATNRGASVAASGGIAVLVVAAQPECPWTAKADSSWIVELKPTEGQGSGQIEARVPGNPTPVRRQGSVKINETSIAIVQDAATCQFQVAPLTASVPFGGGDVTVRVTAMSGCSWTATSHSSWMTVAAGSTGDGNGVVRISVSANGGTVRSSTLTIAGQTVTVQQAAATPVPGPPACTYTVSPISHSASPLGGISSTAVTTTSSCAWSANSNVSWLTITSASAGNGSGAVTFTVAANSGSARSGTLTIAGQTFTVDQAGLCSFSINPNTSSFSSKSGSGSVAVTAGAGCTWTAVSNDAWITVTSGAIGSGSGTVGYSVLENLGNDRVGTITIAGLTFAVQQDEGD